jgi:RES domain-containing protein
MALITTYRLAFTDSLMSAFKPRGAPARWNNEGVVMAYTSEHPALAAFEILNYWEEYSSLDGYSLFSSAFETSLVKELEIQPKGLFDLETTRTIGDDWISSRSSVALRVPSVALPRSFNYLLNPNHPSFYDGVQLEAHGPFAFDARVKKLISQGKK